MFLLDTNVISGARRRAAWPRLQAWLGSVSADRLYTAANVLAEIEQGIRHMEQRDARQGAALRSWFEQRVLAVYGTGERALPFDLAAARRYGAYRIPEHAPSDDAHIAAVAETNGLIVATRNTKHFEPLGVQTINPFEFGG
jgi:predicted nucleic acid-binding protein